MEGVFGEPHVLAAAGNGVALCRRVVLGRPGVKNGAHVTVAIEWFHRGVGDEGNSGYSRCHTEGNYKSRQSSASKEWRTRAPVFPQRRDPSWVKRVHETSLGLHAL